MKKRLLVVTGLVFATGGLSAQSDAMSDADMRAAVKEVDVAMSRLLKIAPLKVSAGTPSVAKRADAVRLLDQLFTHYEPSFRTTPRPFRTAKGAVAARNKDKDVQDSLNKLAVWGLAGPVGPLATGGDSLTHHEFGDALGYFYAGIALRTYQPDPQWTPDLIPSELPDEE